MAAAIFDLEGTLVRSVEMTVEAIHEFRSRTRTKLLERGILPDVLVVIEASILMRKRAIQ